MAKAARKNQKHRKKSKVSRSKKKLPRRSKASKKKAKKKAKKKVTKKKKVTRKKAAKKKATKKKTAKKKTKAKKKKTATKKSTKKKSKATKKKTTKKKAAKRKPAKKASPKKNTAKAAPTLKVVEAPVVQKGDMAPIFTLPTQAGTPLSLSEYRGKNVVLYFYPKDDTPGCTKESCSFRDNISEFEQRNTVVLGVSLDDEASHQKFINKYSLNFPLLCDTEAHVSKAYGCYQQKNMYGNIKWGIVRSTFVIDKEGRIAEAFRRVKVDGHTEQVLGVLDQLES